MSTTVTVTIRCDRRDADGWCGSAYRHPYPVANARQAARGHGWQLTGNGDLCPRCASRTVSDSYRSEAT